MSLVDGGGSTPNQIQRVRDILMRPKPTWDVIDGETASIKGLYTGYIAILAALPAVAGLIGGAMTAPFRSGGSVLGALFGYGMALLGAYVFARVVEAMTPSFDGTASRIQAFKAVAYGATAAWVGGGLSFIPVLGWLAALAGGLYSIYLLYLGLPKLMKVPQDKALGFVIACIVLAIVIQALIAWVAAILMMALGVGGMGAAAMIGQFPMR